MICIKNMFSRIVKFAKPYTPTRCLFPAANTPLKRSICATVGITVGGGTIYISNEYVIPYAWNKITNGSTYIDTGLNIIFDKLEKRRKEKQADRDIARARDRVIEDKNKDYNKTELDVIIYKLINSKFVQTSFDCLYTCGHYVFKGMFAVLDVVVIITGLVVSSTGIYLLVDNTKEWLKSIAKTTECCDIVRHTGLTCLRIPLFVLFSICGLGISLIGLDMILSHNGIDNPIIKLIESVYENTLND